METAAVGISSSIPIVSMVVRKSLEKPTVVGAVKQENISELYLVEDMRHEKFWRISTKMSTSHTMTTTNDTREKKCECAFGYVPPECPLHGDPIIAAQKAREMERNRIASKISNLASMKPSPVFDYKSVMRCLEEDYEVSDKQKE